MRYTEEIPSPRGTFVVDSGGRVVEEVLVGGAAGGEAALFAAGSPRAGESLLSMREDIFFFGFTVPV